MMAYHELLIGCGSRRNKLIHMPENPTFTNLTTLDLNPDHNPDIIHDLTILPLPFADNSFDEIHAYEVLEHTGSQGDYQFFFDQFSDFWRILKPGGQLFATCPTWNGVWAWGDPSHTRTIQPESLGFLHQPKYEAEVGHTAMSDFRYIYKADFDITYCSTDSITFGFGLKAIKPSRYKEKT